MYATVREYTGIDDRAFAALLGRRADVEALIQASAFGALAVVLPGEEEVPAEPVTEAPSPAPEEAAPAPVEAPAESATPERPPASPSTT